MVTVIVLCGFNLADFLRELYRFGRQLIGCEIVKPGTKDPDQQAALDILETLRDNHILTSVCGRYGNILKLRPPLVFSESDVDWFMDGFTKTLETLKL